MNRPEHALQYYNMLTRRQQSVLTIQCTLCLACGLSLVNSFAHNGLAYFLRFGYTFMIPADRTIKLRLIFNYFM